MRGSFHLTALEKALTAEEARVRASGGPVLTQPIEPGGGIRAPAQGGASQGPAGRLPQGGIHSFWVGGIYRALGTEEPGGSRWALSPSWDSVPLAPQAPGPSQLLLPCSFSSASPCLRPCMKRSSEDQTKGAICLLSTGTSPDTQTTAGQEEMHAPRGCPPGVLLSPRGSGEGLACGSPLGGLPLKPPTEKSRFEKVTAQPWGQH